VRLKAEEYGSDGNQTPLKQEPGKHVCFIRKIFETKGALSNGR
jgi:hypothetical protein